MLEEVGDAPREMTSDLDIYRTANEHIKHFGENAAIHAAMKADEMLLMADFDGHAVWIRVMKAVDELLCESVSENTKVH